jgi:hypothetical protein
MAEHVLSPEADRDPTADGDRALQATRDTRVQFALEAPELFRRLMAIAKNDEHSRQLDALRLALGYALGAPTLRVEARVQSQAIPPEVMLEVAEALKSTRDAFEAHGVPHLLTGDEVIPKPGEIAAAMAQLEEPPTAADAAPPQPPPAEPEPYRPRFDPEAPLRRRDVPGTPIRR